MFVLDCEPEHGAVLERADPLSRLLVGEARGGREGGADRAGMGDAEHVISCMATAEVEQRGDDACRELLVRLAVRPTGSPRDVGSLREPRPDLVHGHALPVADVDLAESLELLRLEPQLLGNDPSRLARASQRARVDRAQAFGAQDVSELASLPASGLVERSVGVPLEAALAIPVGLAVSDEDDRRRHAG